MADGGFKSDDNSGPMSFVYRFPGQLRDYWDRKCGACVPDHENNSDALVTEKFATAFLRFTNASGVLTLSSGLQKALLLTKGVGEAATDAGGAGNLTAADTNAFKDGGLVTTGQRFQIISVGVEILDPFEYDAANADRTKPVWMDGYRADLQRLVMRDCVFRLKPAESQNIYDMGPLAHYPCHLASPSVGDTFAQIGAPMVNAPKPLRAMLVSGSKIESRRLEIYVDAAHTMIIRAKGDPADTDVVVPVKFTLTGRPVRGLASDETNAAGNGEVSELREQVNQLVQVVRSIAKG